MDRTLSRLSTLTFAASLLVACGDGDSNGAMTGAGPDAGAGADASTADASGDTGSVEAPLTVPEFGRDDTRQIRGVASASEGLSRPLDLAFNPEDPTTLWVASQDNDSMLIVFDAEGSDPTFDLRQDEFRNHFMEEVAGFAFGANSTFASCHESRNTYDGQAPPNDFMGPALWPSDLDIFARVFQDPFGDLAGSHLDMLHESPLCMGIAHYRDNIYFVNDGSEGDLVYYDFVEDHGPGEDYHSDGIVYRYPEIELTRVPGVPGHMEMDGDILYIADTGGSRVLAVDVTSGERGRSLFPFGEPLAEYAQYVNMDWSVFAEDTLDTPSGLAIHDGRLFVGDYATGEIVAFDLETREELGRLDTLSEELVGLEVSPNGELWFIDAAFDEVLHVVP